MNFNYIPFLSLLENIVDNRGRTCPTSDDGIPLIATNCVLNTSLYPVFEKIRYVDEETYKTWFRGHPKPGDMLFVTKGTPGRVCWVPDPVGFCIAQDMVAIRANKELIYPKYLFALLRSNIVQKMIENMHVGTLIPHFKKGDFDKLLLPVPTDYKIQEKIGNLYFDICEKIELNRQTNATLEAIAQSIFREWFVDFNFPNTTGEMVESELGIIPQGWNIRSLYASATYINGAAYKNIPFSPDKSGLPVIKINELKYGITSQTNFTTSELESKYKIENGEILFSWSGSPDTSLDVFVWSGGSAWLNQHIFRILPHNPFEAHYIYYLLKHLKPVIIEIARDKQTTGLGHITVQDMKRMQVLNPPERVLQAFSKMVAPIFDRIFVSELESRSLIEIREILLPKLMSREIEV